VRWIDKKFLGALPQSFTRSQPISTAVSFWLRMWRLVTFG